MLLNRLALPLNRGGGTKKAVAYKVALLGKFGERDSGQKWEWRLLVAVKVQP